MSKEAALAFLQKALTDATLQDKIVAFAAEQGYEFTAEEMTGSVSAMKWIDISGLK